MTPELYIEEIAARAGLEGARRDHHIPRLRAQLHDLTHAAEATGLPPEEAQATAMREMGTPETIARELGSRTNFMWVVLEAVAIGVVAYFFAIMTIGRIYRAQGLTSEHIILTAVLFAILYAVFRICKRVWVEDESLHYYRAFRSRITIPFESITSVQTERGRLFGAHRIQINYGEKHSLKVKSDLPNYRFLTAGLEEYVPEKLDENVKQYLQQQRQKSASMSTWKKILLTLVWLLAAALMLFMVNLTWTNAGILYTFAGGILLAAITAGSGICFARERVKRLLFAILTAGFIWLFQLCFTALMFDISFRSLLWLALTALPLAIFITWWSSRTRWIQFGVGIVWLTAIYAACYLLPPTVHSSTKSLGTAPLIVESSLWMTPEETEDGPIIFCHGLSYRKKTDEQTDTRNQFAIFHNGIALGRDLPPGDWSLLDRLTTDTVLLSHTAQDNDSTQSLVQFYTLDTAGELKPDVSADGTWSGFLNLAQPIMTLSPTHQFVVTATNDMALVIVDRDAETTKTFSQFRTNQVWKWENDHTLALLHRKPTEPKEVPDGQYAKWLLDIATGLTTQTGTVNIGSGWYLYGPPSADYSMARSDNELGIVKLSDGTSMTLPQRDEESPIDWDPALNRVTYISVEGDKKKVVVAGPDGVIAHHLVDSNRKFAWTKLSPDASRVFLVSQLENYHWMLPVAKLAVWDIASDKIVTVGQEPSVYAVLLLIARSGITPRIDSVLWTPDSKNIVWPAGHFFMDTNLPGMELELITPEL